MFKTVCPPIKVIKGVQDGLLATLLGRTLIKRPEADSGPLSWALASAVFGWFLWIPTARVKAEAEPRPPHCRRRRRETSATILSHLSHLGDSLSEGPEQKGSWKEVCVWGGGRCVWERVSVHSPVFTDKPWALLGVWHSARHSACRVEEQTSVSPLRKPRLNEVKD